MPISIETFTQNDRADWLELWKAYLIFYKADLPLQIGEQTWDRMIAPDGDIHGFKACGEDGAMLGMVTFLYHATTWSPDQRCYLHDLFTVPEARGKGVGKALIEAVYDAAAQSGAGQVYWLTQEFNYPGRMLYDKVADKTDFIKYAKNL